jgi:hypothetical protein
MDASLYVILDRTAARGRDLEAILEAALAGGCRTFQLREKAWPSGRALPLAERLRARCREAGAVFIVNDRVDLALAAGADGVHLGQDDLPPRAARPLLRAGMILGLRLASRTRRQAAGGLRRWVCSTLCLTSGSSARRSSGLGRDRVPDRDQGRHPANVAEAVAGADRSARDLRRVRRRRSRRARLPRRDPQGARLDPRGRPL